MDAADTLLAVRAAELYHELDLTQDAIAQRLGLSRWKVGRLLADAKQEGLVTVTIHHPQARRPRLEQELRERFALDDAIVVSTADPGLSATARLPDAPAHGPSHAARLATVAAHILATLRPAPRVLGVSWGRTLAAIASALPTGWAHGVRVVQLNGGTTATSPTVDAIATITTIARRGEGAAQVIPSPAILQHIDTKQALEREPLIRAALAAAHDADTALFSAGPADETSIHVHAGSLRPDEMARLVRRGAVGDVLGRFLTAQGTLADPTLDARTLGLNLDHLRAIPRSIAVIGGASKRPIAAAILRARLCRILITDAGTATWLLDQSPAPATVPPDEGDSPTG